MNSSPRVILIVLDSAGIGALPDANRYGDVGADTLGHIARSVEGFQLPNLADLGLGSVEGVTGIPKAPSPSGAFGRAAEHAHGKDTTTGHWEIAGLHHDLSFPYFPDGFPPVLVKEFEKRIGRESIGNKVASGTEIIDELGDEHVRSGKPIIYTSSDSVFQIAMHEDIIPLDEQYRICQIARDLLTGEWAVGRVIARPFTGSSGNYRRTHNRKDYSILPPGKTILDLVVECGQPVGAVGKIYDIFAGQGITESLKTTDNTDGVKKTIELMARQKSGLIFTNLVDFDMLFGHRRDVIGYARCLEEFDRQVPDLLRAMNEKDVLILTADHGNDPTFRGTDHTREYIPILVAGQMITAGAHIGTRQTFADISATIADILNSSKPEAGTSFYAEICR
jgi:phosphopentomutase